MGGTKDFVFDGFTLNWIDVGEAQLRVRQGGSGPPVLLHGHLARDCAALMSALGHERFAVSGHDRGLYVASRLAIDSPERVSRLVVMDGVPIGEALARADARFASAWWHWFFLGQTAKPAERVINADPDAWYPGTPEAMGEENYADFRRATRDLETVHAMVEDYRAGLVIDRAADDADWAAGRRISSPDALHVVDS